MKTQLLYCFNCGEELGVGEKIRGEYDTCGRPECLREAQRAYRADDEEAQWRAIDDNFDRYR